VSKLEWKLLTKKRGSATQGVPPGKEDLAWVAGTVTLISGQRDAVLVDTFLLEQHLSGDCVYNNTHLYLAECDDKARGEWLCAVDTIEALHPRAVVAGHGVLDPDSSPRHIEETRRYIRDFNACLAITSTPQELYERMLSLHVNRVNPGSLWAAAKAAKPPNASRLSPLSTLSTGKDIQP
jgi:hypothetical protein